MSEWENLKIDKLPEDILTGDYEFMSIDTTTSCSSDFYIDVSKIKNDERLSILSIAQSNDSTVVMFRKMNSDEIEAIKYYNDHFTCDGEWRYQYIGYKGIDIDFQTFPDMVKAAFKAGRESKI